MSRDRKLFIGWFIAMSLIVGTLTTIGMNCTDCFVISDKYEIQGQ